MSFDAPEHIAALTDGKTVFPVQRTHTGDALIHAAGLPAYGGVHLRACAPDATPNPFSIEGFSADNGLVRMTLDGNGEIPSLVDLHARRELAQSPLNHLVLYEDMPPDFDAWDIPRYFRRKAYPLGVAESILWVEAGPVRATAKVVRRFGRSVLWQYISLYADSMQVEIRTVVDWNEYDHLLKAAFPLALHTRRTTYDIQFGNVERPTHANTSWDAARFEVCGHKWADISESNYGVALLNDSKYGHSATGSTLELTLLRSPTYPNKSADRERHEFIYCLLPHQGRWQGAGVNRAAYALNRPPVAVCAWGGTSVKTGPRETTEFVTCSSEAAILDTIKPAEDGRGVILRLFEGEGSSVEVTLHFACGLSAACECDMLENDGPTISTGAGNTLALQLSPYEIKTLRILWASPAA